MTSYTMPKRISSSLNVYCNNLEGTINNLACILASANQELLTLEDGLQELRSYLRLYNNRDETVTNSPVDPEDDKLPECHVEQRAESFLRGVQRQLEETYRMSPFQGNEEQMVNDEEYFNFMMKEIKQQLKAEEDYDKKHKPFNQGSFQ